MISLIFILLSQVFAADTLINRSDQNLNSALSLPLSHVETIAQEYDSRGVLVKLIQRRKVGSDLETILTTEDATGHKRVTTFRNGTPIELIETYYDKQNRSITRKFQNPIAKTAQATSAHPDPNFFSLVEIEAPAPFGLSHTIHEKDQQGHWLLKKSFNSNYQTVE